MNQKVFFIKDNEVKSAITNINNLPITARKLDVSTKGLDPLGNALSAFSLRSNNTLLETHYQSLKITKCDNKSHPEWCDIETYKHTKTVYKVKRQPKLRTGILGFDLEGKKYPLTESVHIYNYIYVKALLNNKKLIDEAKNYTFFYDSAFNYTRCYATQARAITLAILLDKLNILEKACVNYETFKNVTKNLTDYK